MIGSRAAARHGDEALIADGRREWWRGLDVAARADAHWFSFASTECPCCVERFAELRTRSDEDAYLAWLTAVRPDVPDVTDYDGEEIRLEYEREAPHRGAIDAFDRTYEAHRRGCCCDEHCRCGLYPSTGDDWSDDEKEGGLLARTGRETAR
jgi:hypothetical protein